MKIIDLLNRIAKDEGIPIKIKFKDKTWEWNSEFYDYRCEEDNHRYLVEDLEAEDLNRTCEEIPIIEDKPFSERVEEIYKRHIDYIYGEEDKKIEKLERHIPQWEGELYCTKYNEVADKINEIIDKLNKEE